MATGKEDARHLRDRGMVIGPTENGQGKAVVKVKKRSKEVEENACAYPRRVGRCGCPDSKVSHR